VYKKLLLGLLCCIYGFSLISQSSLKGQVIAPDGEPLPFVNIVINEDAQFGTTTDIDGRFALPKDRPIRQLRLSYIGYLELVLEMDTVDITPPWQIKMQPQAYDFAAVEVVAGVNFADVIMRRVIKNRHGNDPENLESYRCRTYNKMVMSWLPNRAAFEAHLAKKQADQDSIELTQRQERKFKLMENAQKQHLFMMESLTERLFRRPSAYSETILANKVSGFQEAPFAALANEVQPFSFYQEEVMLLDKAFLNPISPGSPERYFFHVEDTLYRRQDTVYLLTFHPRKQRNFNGLKGLLYINTDGYAVQNIIAEPADTTLIHFRIEQQYNRPEGQKWFPVQLNFLIQMPKYPDPHLGLQIRGKSYVDEVQQNLPLDTKPFKRNERYVFADSAYGVPELAWRRYRPEPLDRLEETTYQVVDSIGEQLHFDKWMDRLDALGKGRWPLGLVDLSLSKLVQFNQFESIRLGLGLYTSEIVSSWFTIGGYAGYGVRDQRWKYGAEVQFFPDWDKNWEWRWFYQKDLSEAGGQGFALRPGLVSRRLFADRMDEIERFGTFLRLRPVRFLEVGIEASHNQFQALYDYRYQAAPDVPAINRFQLSEAAIHLHYAYGQQYRRILGNRVPDGKERPFPAFSLSLRRGFGAAFDGDFPYWQAWAAIDHSFRLIRLGKTSYRIEAAVSRGDVPLSRLYQSAGLGRDFQFLIIGNLFQTMDPYEFLSDRYLSLFFRQDFGTLLFKTKWLQPSISVEHHFTIGDLSKPEKHRGIEVNTLTKGYAEAGLIIDNIFRLNYLNFAYLGLGGGVYYRYGAYHLPGGVGENLAFRISLDFDF
jgi:hypothetical protein